MLTCACLQQLPANSGHGFICMCGACPPSTFNPACVQAVAPRDLIDWCAARLAQYKVPSAVHILPRMPTTGSGKILKTELRRMFCGGSTSLASAAGAAAGDSSGVAAPAAVPAAGPAAGLAEAAAVLAAACGGDVPCLALDDGLGVEWGRELLPQLTYLLTLDSADKLAAQASAGGACMACGRLVLLPAILLKLALPLRCLHTSPARLFGPHDAPHSSAQASSREAGPLVAGRGGDTRQGPAQLGGGLPGEALP